VSEIQKLETLLSRVQERRTQPRGSAAPEAFDLPAAPIAAAKPAVAAATRSLPTERAAVVEERVSLPGARPAAPQPQARLPEPPQAQPASPNRGRLSTPLEMALEDELSRPPLAAAASRAAAPPKITEPSMPAAPKGSQFAPDDEPFTIDPEPMREPARPIAQTMSKHSVEMDITFGAMLKRSLSLRPR
jgi:hypothetical protein